MKRNYKILKALTIKFATDAIDPNVYVDETALLFHSRSANLTFLKCALTLIVQCSNSMGVNLTGRRSEMLRKANSGSGCSAKVSSSNL